MTTLNSRARLLGACLIAAAAGAHADPGAALARCLDQDAGFEDRVTACTEVLSDPAMKEAHFKAYVRRADANGYLGRHDAALSDISLAIALEPGNPKGHAFRGSLHASHQRYEQAVADLGVALSLDPRDAYALGHRAYAYQQLGDKRRALADRDALVSLEPGNANAIFDRAGLHAALKHWDQAAADYRRALELQPAFAGDFEPACIRRAAPDYRPVLVDWPRCERGR